MELSKAVMLQGKKCSLHWDNTWCNVRQGLGWVFHRSVSAALSSPAFLVFTHPLCCHTLPGSPTLSLLWVSSTLKHTCKFSFFLLFPAALVLFFKGEVHLSVHSLSFVVSEFRLSWFVERGLIACLQLMKSRKIPHYILVSQTGCRGCKRCVTVAEDPELVANSSEFCSVCVPGRN